MYNKTIQATIILSISVIVAFGVPSAYAVTYHTGWLWSSSHSEELDNGSIPFALVTSEINNLPKAAGTTGANLQTAIEASLDDWNDSTNVSMHRDDTTTAYFDNEVGTTNLGLGNYAVTNYLQHWDWGYHDHLLRMTIDFNNDSSDVTWDHDGDTGATTPDTLDISETSLHEFGHTIGLCGTYVGDNQSAGDCTTVTTTDSAMRSYPWGTDRTITTGDQAEINAHY